MPDEEVHRFVNDLERPVGTYLYGRRMYEVMRYWDTAEAIVGQHDVAVDFANIWRAANKIVYSRSLRDVSTGRTRLAHDFDAESIRQLKATERRDISIGGPELAAGALKAGLVDQIEWFHRFLGVAGGLALAALVVTTLVAYRSNRRLVALVVAAGLLYISQALIGAIVVILELPQTWVTAHLANAELILAVLTTLAVGVRWPSTIAARDRGAPWTALLLAGAVGTFVLMLTGAYVRGDDATTACTTWPLCD